MPDGEQSSRPLRARFGELATYPVVEDPWSGTGCAIDFGFYHVWRPGALAGFETARPGDIISLSDDQSGLSCSLRQDNPRLWTYAARLRRVVDGDTLTTMVHLGDGQLSFPRLRLRGIDTPELYTLAGRRARDFVVRALANAAILVVTTWRTDGYGRYLADLKYLPGVSDPQVVLAKGMYLNRQLLDEGLATRYQ